MMAEGAPGGEVDDYLGYASHHPVGRNDGEWPCIT